MKAFSCLLVLVSTYSIAIGQQSLDTGKYNYLSNSVTKGDTSGKWLHPKRPYPLPGAILPFNRVIAYYGNLSSTRMGALGRWPKDSMIQNLLQETRRWEAADSLVKPIPAFEYLAVTAQSLPGADGKYRLRMPHKQIDTVLAWAKEIGALVILNIQPGLSDWQQEVPLLDEYLARPNVHLSIDPEFAMKHKGGKIPGAAIGTIDAAEINWVSQHLATIVNRYNLPPKMLVVDRFTKGMVTNYKSIALRKEVQIVMCMDGWGPTSLKEETYELWISDNPVQFAGFKLFYRNDTEKSHQTEMMSPREVLQLVPQPVLIEYQ